MGVIFRSSLLCVLLFSFCLSGALASDGTLKDDNSSEERIIGNLSISGTVFEDITGNFRRDGAEQGLGGWRIALLQDGLEVSNTTSGPRGDYAFYDLVPGVYSLEEEAADGWRLTSPANSSLQAVINREPEKDLDFGNMPSVSASSPEEQAIMHPTLEVAQGWMMHYNATPGAFLSPQIRSELQAAGGASFDLLDSLPYTASQRNQGSCGNCWAWAGTGVMEIDNARQNGILNRLSIQYLNSNYNGGSGARWACCGGWLSDVSEFYSEMLIEVPWSNTNATWRDKSRSCGSYKSAVLASDISTDPHYSITSIEAQTVPTHESQDAAIASIKNVLQQGRAVWFAFFLPDSNSWSSFRSFWNNNEESAIYNLDKYDGSTYDSSNGGAHAVLCVGYDDTDPDNSYWIMLNSWGSSSLRPNGLFRINMDMNYDCSYSGFGYAFYWMTLDIAYPGGSNNPPETPNAPGGPDAGYAYAPYDYSASAKDPEGDSVMCTFDWGDGSTTETGIVQSEESVSASHAWSSAGTYEVMVKATDASGKASGWSGARTMTIASNQPPKKPSKPSGTSNCIVGSSCSYSTSTKDPDADQVMYTFNWDDGTSTDTQLQASGKKVSVDHLWSSTGTYSVVVKATDSKGAPSSLSNALTVVVNPNRPPKTPSRPSGSSKGYAGTSYSYSTLAKDPDGDELFYTFDWGDETEDKTGLVDSGTRSSMAHAWNEAGTYYLKARATDSRGDASDWSSTLKVTIAANSAPAVPDTPSGATSGKVRRSYAYSTSATDPDGDKVKYTFDWGDGKTSTTGYVKSGVSSSASHKWSSAGTYQIVSRATDSKGRSSVSWSEPLAVTIA